MSRKQKKYIEEVNSLLNTTNWIFKEFIRFQQNIAKVLVGFVLRFEELEAKLNMLQADLTEQINK